MADENRLFSSQYFYENKRLRIPKGQYKKGQSRETGNKTKDEDKQNKNTTQYVYRRGSQNIKNSVNY